MFDCCCQDASDSSPRQMKPRRKCTDLVCLFIFIVFWVFTLFYFILSFILGNPLHLIYGVDSFGNVCGQKNSPISDSVHSGLDLTKAPYLFYLNTANLSHSLQICVEKCPDRDFENPQELITFYRATNVSLCRYDINFEEYIFSESVAPLRKQSDTGLGPCPKFPVFKS